MLSRAALYVTIAIFVAGLLFPGTASAHNVSKRDASFVQSNKGAAIAPFVYLGAKHMVTGYDHLAFLVGVIFFLYKLKDIVLYVSLFTIGHSITLLAGVLGGIHANSYIIDAIIGFSVVYKAFDNMDGFKRLFGFRAQHENRGSDFRLVPRLWSGHQASGTRSRQERTDNEHRQLQRRRGNRTSAGADGRIDRAQLLANAQRISPPRIRDQYRL